jgi:hypothetical protein
LEIVLDATDAMALDALLRMPPEPFIVEPVGPDPPAGTPADWGPGPREHVEAEAEVGLVLRRVLARVTVATRGP